MSSEPFMCHETNQKIPHKIKPNDRETSSAAALRLVCFPNNMKVNVVMIIGNIPKHTVAPYTVVESGYLHREIHKCFEAKL